MSLKGKYAVVSGSSAGVSRGIALNPAEQSVKVAMSYRRNEAVTDGKSFLRAFTREKRSLTCGIFSFLSSSL